MKILRLRDNKFVTKEELARELSNNGQKIIWSDIECIARDVENKLEQNYFLLDECGNYAYIDKKLYKIMESD